ncbi:MAG: hypothetical protein AB1758_27775, partial [Candidatus Eremiobacterota bacterium]
GAVAEIAVPAPEEIPRTAEPVTTPPEGGPAPQGGDFFFKFYTGFNSNLNSDVRVLQPGPGNDLTFHDVVWDAKPFNHETPYYGYRIGYFLEDVPWLGVMLDYTHFKYFARTSNTVRVTGTRFGAPFDATVPMDGIVEEYEVCHGLNMVTFNAVGRLQLDVSEEFPHGRFQPYAGFGLGPTVHHPEIEVDGMEAPVVYQWGGLGVQGLVGVSFLLIPEVDLFLEYKFTHTDADHDLALGKGQAALDSHHWIFGTGFHW